MNGELWVKYYYEIPNCQMNSEDFKKKAAQKAIEKLRGKKIVGIGTGSTVKHLIDEIGADKTHFHDTLFVPTSNDSEKKLIQYGLKVTHEFAGFIDITVDGCDEIDPEGRRIKGGGGALTREKMVAYNSREVVIIADSTKSVDKLGDFGVPVEILPFLWKNTVDRLSEFFKTDIKGNPEAKTDNGNMVAIARTGKMDNPEKVFNSIKNIPGVVEVGIFLNLTNSSIICGPGGCSIKDYPLNKR